MVAIWAAFEPAVAFDRGVAYVRGDTVEGTVGTCVNDSNDGGAIAIWASVGTTRPPGTRTTTGKRVPPDDPFTIAMELCMNIDSLWQAVYPEAADMPTLDEVYAFVVANPRRRWAAS